MKYPALITIAFISLFCSCEKVEDINVINSPKGGSATITVKNGFDFFEPVIINTSFTSETMGLIKRGGKYTLILEKTNNEEVINQLLLNFSTYDLVSGSVDSGQFVSALPGEGLHTFDMPSNHSAVIYDLQVAEVGQKSTGAFWFPANNQYGGYYRVDGTFEAYRLPDSE